MNENTVVLRFGEEEERVSRDRVVEEPPSPEAFVQKFIEPPVPEGNAEQAREEPSPTGVANNPNRETPLTHKTPINSTNEAPDPRTRTKKITTDVFVLVRGSGAYHSNCSEAQ